MKKRKKRYHTGKYISTKSLKEYKYRSGWEKIYMQFLDNSQDVLSWEYEPFFIEYFSNKRTKKIKKYYPDFVVFKENEKILVEIKPSKKLTQAIVQKKIYAAQEWCLTNNFRFQIICENEIGVMKKQLLSD